MQPCGHGDAYLLDSGAFCQSGGRFLPGSGQAGHSTAHAPSRVAEIPSGSLPRPVRFIILRWRHSRVIVRNAG